ISVLQEGGKSRLHQTQEEVEQVKMIMLDNKKKAEERSDNLKDLELQAEVLREKSKVFERTTKKLKQQKEMSNKKTKIIIIFSVVAGLIILGLIIFVITKFAG
uniref:V-SNARE coiled-coil homology domain-containing protein n=1 Tax=Poecilia mexicana TaxID=48701 RepID=A0A3B3Z220_9TELE